MIFVCQKLHALFEVIVQEILGHVEALQFVHGFDLLLPLHASVFQSLVLYLDAADFLLDLVLPVAVLGLSAGLVLFLELYDVFQFKFFFYLETGLVNRFAQQHIQNWLYLYVVVKEVIVLDLGDLIDACLLWDVLGSGRFRLEFVCLQFHFCLLGLLLALLGQEVGEVDINTGRWSWSEVVWTGGVL